jgi:primosomal protein N'
VEHRIRQALELPPYQEQLPMNLESRQNSEGLNTL